ncbi:hypothetical protein ACEQ8H_002522 [Pleosporales sp. CAS-2024a]
MSTTAMQYAREYFVDVADAIGAMRSVESIQALRHNRSNWHRLTLCILDITLYERDLQLYYEGLVLADRYGKSFTRNLGTEHEEQERRK